MAERDKNAQTKDNKHVEKSNIIIIKDKKNMPTLHSCPRLVWQAEGCQDLFNITIQRLLKNNLLGPLNQEHLSKTTEPIPLIFKNYTYCLTAQFTSLDYRDCHLEIDGMEENYILIKRQFIRNNCLKIIFKIFEKNSTELSSFKNRATPLYFRFNLQISTKQGLYYLFTSYKFLIRNQINSGSTKPQISLMKPF